jgi:hypothetical protein
MRLLDGELREWFRQSLARAHSRIERDQSIPCDPIEMTLARAYCSANPAERGLGNARQSMMAMSRGSGATFRRKRRPDLSTANGRLSRNLIYLGKVAEAPESMGLQGRLTAEAS